MVGNILLAVIFAPVAQVVWDRIIPGQPQAPSTVNNVTINNYNDVGVCVAQNPGQVVDDAATPDATPP